MPIHLFEALYVESQLGKDRHERMTHIRDTHERMCQILDGMNHVTHTFSALILQWTKGNCVLIIGTSDRSLKLNEMNLGSSICKNTSVSVVLHSLEKVLCLEVRTDGRYTEKTHIFHHIVQNSRWHLLTCYNKFEMPQANW